MNRKETDYKPLVSFILPCYNISTELLKECLNSILCLSLKPYEREIILVDDGSKNPVKNEIPEYINDITYIRQNNQGPSAARNTGIDNAKGKYIQFVDADDKLKKIPYERCLEIVRQKKPDMVLFKFTHKENINSKSGIYKETDATNYMLNNNIYGSPWWYIFKREILGDLHFPVGRFHEDEEFTPLLFLRANKIYSTNNNAYFYRYMPVSTMHNKNRQFLVRRLFDIEYVIFRLHDISISLSSEKKPALQRRVAQITMDYIYNIIMITRSSTQLKRRIERLRKKGLFPLPDRNYTIKYTLFRMFINNNIIRKLFCYIFLK